MNQQQKTMIKKATSWQCFLADSTFIVIDEATGHQFEWMQVIVEGYEKQKTYVYKKFTEKLESTKESAEIKFSDKAVSVENQQATDWTHKESSSVWFEKKTASWCVVVERPSRKSTGGAQLTTRMNDAVDFGLWRILSENSKEGGSTSYERYRCTIQKTRIARQIYFAKAQDWFLSPRPDSNLRFLLPFLTNT